MVATAQMIIEYGYFLSPPDDNKKALLQLLANNEEITKEIDMGSSVEDTKRVLMENCL